VPGLVHRLVHRLIEHQGSQQRGVGLRVHPAGLGIALAERSLAALHPLVRGQAESLGIRAVKQLMAGGVVERAEHAGHVAQRDVRGPALRERHHGLSLEVQDHPARRRAQYLPEMVVAVYALHDQRGADRGQLGVVAAELGRVRAQRGHLGAGAIQLAGHLPGHIGVRLGRELGDAERGGQVGVHLRGGRAQPERLTREITAGLIRPDRPLSLHAVAGVQVAQAGGRQRPAIAGPGQVPRQDREQHRLVAVPGLDPPERLGHVRRAAPGQRAVHLEVRVLAGEEPAQHLQDGRLAEDQARVALLAGQHEAVESGFDDRARLPGEAHRADGPLLGQAGQEDLRELGIMQRLVGGPARSGRSHDRVPQRAGQLRADADQDLVPGGPPARGHGDDQLPQLGLAGGQRGIRGYGEVTDRSVGAGVPTLGWQPRR
jgi:hypothetical protein